MLSPIEKIDTTTLTEPVKTTRDPGQSKNKGKPAPELKTPPLDKGIATPAPDENGSSKHTIDIRI